MIFFHFLHLCVFENYFYLSLLSALRKALLSRKYLNFFFLFFLAMLMARESSWAKNRTRVIAVSQAAAGTMLDPESPAPQENSIL